MSKTKLKICRDTDCEKDFMPFKSTDVYCSYECTIKNVKPSKPRKPINRKSKTQKELDRLYLKLRKIFLSKPENKYCRVFPKRLANQVHHKAGRIGKLYLYVKYWLPVSQEGHNWINDNPEKAYEKGFCLKRTSINHSEL